MRKIYYTWIGVALMALAACTTTPQIPTTFSTADMLPCIYPDYVDVTVPQNIAPLTFRLDEESDNIVARWSVGKAE